MVQGKHKRQGVQLRQNGEAVHQHLPARSRPEDEDPSGRLFEQYRPLVRRLAQQLSRGGTGCSTLIEVGEDALVDTLLTRARPHRVSETTWLWRNVRWAMLDYLRALRRRPAAAPLPLCSARPTLSDRIRSLYENVGAEGAAVMRLVFEGPAELLSALRDTAPQHSRAALVNHLQGQGWSDQRIARSFTEIAHAIHEA